MTDLVCVRVFLVVYILECIRKCHVSALTVCLFDMELGATVDFEEFCLLPENQGMNHAELSLEFNKYDKNHNDHLARSELKRFHDDHDASKVTLTQAGSMPDDRCNPLWRCLSKLARLQCWHSHVHLLHLVQLRPHRLILL
jgi:hypothetical protein